MILYTLVIGNKLDLKVAAAAAAAAATTTARSSTSENQNNVEDNESSNEEDDEKRSNSQGENEQTWMDNPGESQRNNGEDDTIECKDSQQTVLQWCRDNSYGHLETSAKGELNPMNLMLLIAQH